MDHDRPSGAAERLPRAHGRRADRLPEAGLGRSRGGRARADRRGRARVLRGRRSEAARGDRRLRSLRQRPVRGGDAPSHDPRGAQAGDRGRQRLRDRRRPCAAPAVRPVDRGRPRRVRADRAARGLLRRGLRHRLPGARGRREARARDLVPVPPLRRGHGRALGPGQPRRAGIGAARRGAPLRG